MIHTLRRRTGVYASIAAMVPKAFMAYRGWFWVGILLNTILMAIFVYLWKAVYASTDSIAGLNLQQTLNYILLARLFFPLTDLYALWEFGYSIRKGEVAVALLRPVDLQASFYAQSLASAATLLLWQVPQAVVATLLFGLQWPTDPGVWAVFLITAFLGRTIIFFFDWLLVSLAFYTTEIWGLQVLLEGLSLFLSGSLIPLVMMPGWLQAAAQAFPFAQAIYAPLSLLTGITPLEQAPSIWLTQLVWLVGLGLVSRLAFRRAVRKVTVQGG